MIFLSQGLIFLGINIMNLLPNVTSPSIWIARLWSWTFAGERCTYIFWSWDSILLLFKVLGNLPLISLREISARIVTARETTLPGMRCRMPNAINGSDASLCTSIPNCRTWCYCKTLNHRIADSIELEKNSEIIMSNLWVNTTLSTRP